jgi:ferric-dicitrate binding protein FerR (iron transport regulator)
MTMSRFSDWPNRRFVLKGAIAGASLILPWRPGMAAGDAVGSVKRAQGSALLRRGDGELTAAAGTDILAKDVALTGDQPSRLLLQFGGETIVRLGANSVFEIERFVAGLAQSLQLQQGAAFIEHDSQKTPDLTLRTPYALLAARGTRFFAGPSNGVFGVFVQSGVVDVETSAGKLTLSTGEGTDIAAPGEAPTAPKRWKPPRIRNALASVS